MRKFFLVFVVGIIFSVAVFADTNKGTFGPTTEYDHLWQIAISVRPNKTVTIPQTMVALLKANPHAFLTNNVNALLPKKTLTIPSIEQIKQVSPQSAESEIHKQNQTWKKTNHNTKLNITSVKKAEKEKIITQPKHETSVETKKDQNQVAELQNKLSLTNDALTKISQEVTTRLSTLEANNNLLLMQLATVNDRLNGAEKEIESLRQTQTIEKENFIQRALRVVKINPNFLVTKSGRIAYSTILAALGLILIIILILMLRKHKSEPETSRVTPSFGGAEKKPEKEEEYDMLSGEESIQTKLNLARAYVDMGQKAQASEILQEVLNQGDEAQQHEAKELLNRLV